MTDSTYSNLKSKLTTLPNHVSLRKLNNINPISYLPTIASCVATGVSSSSNAISSAAITTYKSLPQVTYLSKLSVVNPIPYIPSLVPFMAGSVYAGTAMALGVWEIYKSLPNMPGKAQSWSLVTRLNPIPHIPMILSCTVRPLRSGVVFDFIAQATYRCLPGMPYIPSWKIAMSAGYDSLTKTHSVMFLTRVKI